MSTKPNFFTTAERTNFILKETKRPLFGVSHNRLLVMSEYTSWYNKYIPPLIYP